MLSEDRQLSGNLSPLLLYGTNPDISGDICRKVDRTFVTEIFEIIKTALCKVYGTAEWVKSHSVAVSYTVASREFVRQIPNTTALQLLEIFRDTLTPEERRYIIER